MKQKGQLAGFQLQRQAQLMIGVLLLASPMLACASKAPAERPMRSPSLDYPPPDAQTSDGRVVGADGKAPADTLKMGPTNEGPAPGWRGEEVPPTYDENDRVGGQTEHDGKSDVQHHHDDKDEGDSEEGEPKLDTEAPVRANPASP